MKVANFSIAEAALKHEEQHPGFSLLLLNIVASESLPLNTRLSGALVFKNFIKFNWVVSGREIRLREADADVVAIGRRRDLQTTPR